MRRTLLATAAVLLIVAAQALAAPAREATLTAGQPYTWEGGPGTGVMPTGGSQVRCTPVYECEDTLVQITEPGDLTAVIKAGDGSEDLDVVIFESDAEGTVNADSPGTSDPQPPKAEDISEDRDAKATARKLKPGHYVIRVRFYAATSGVYTGTATLVPAQAPQPAAPAPTPTPPPAQPAEQPKKKKKASCKAKAKKIKNKQKRKKALKKCKRKER